MNWTCDKVIARLEAYLDGEVRPDARARLEAHLATCEDCRAAADSLRGLGAAVRDVAEDAALTAEEAAAFWPSVRARIREAEAAERRRSLPALVASFARLVRPAVLVPALAAFLGIVVGVGILRWDRFVTPAEAAEVESLEGGPASTVMLLHAGRGKPPIIWIFEDGAGAT